MNDSMQFLRQFSRQREEGYTVYKGEDAFPLATPTVLAVADGLGGTGAIAHSHVHPDAFCRNLVGKRMLGELLSDEKFFETVAPIAKEGPWDHGLDEYFYSWAGRDFLELAAVKDHYQPKNYKKSAYFGSRAAMLLMRLLNQILDREKLFTLASTEEGLAALERMLETYFLFGLNRAAEGLELRRETTFPRLAMLSTTLCGSFIRDCGESVEVLYLVCGDSQAYVLDRDGLALGWGEHMGGGMRSHMNITYPEQAKIRCVRRSYRKPCMLFCATDGCFDAALFRKTPLAFEMTLLGAIARCESMDQVGSFLEEFFDTYGRHDDAASMAACLWGMDYGQLRQLALDRLQQLRKIYPELEERMELVYLDQSREYTRTLRQLEALLKTGWAEAAAGMDPLCAGCVLGKHESAAEDAPEDRALALETRLDKFLRSPCPELLRWSDSMQELRQKLRQCREEFVAAQHDYLLQQRVIETYENTFFRFSREKAQESEV